MQKSFILLCLLRKSKRFSNFSKFFSYKYDSGSFLPCAIWYSFLYHKLCCLRYGFLLNEIIGIGISSLPGYSVMKCKRSSKYIIRIFVSRPNKKTYYQLFSYAAISEWRQKREEKQGYRGYPLLQKRNDVLLENGSRCAFSFDEVFIKTFWYFVKCYKSSEIFRAHNSKKGKFLRSKDIHEHAAKK